MRERTPCLQVLRYSLEARLETYDMGKARWIRNFSTASSFSDDLGSLGACVGPRTGCAKRTQGQKEDYVLRRVLVALHRQGRLNFPFTVRASDQEAPDYVFTDPCGCWGLEVTEAGSECHQSAMTRIEGKAGTQPSRDDLEPFDDFVEEVRRAIERKNKKFDDGAYRSVSKCDLAVYDNTNSYAASRHAVASVSDPSLRGQFREVYFVREQEVYPDLLCSGTDRPKRVVSCTS